MTPRSQPSCWSGSRARAILSFESLRLGTARPRGWASIRHITLIALFSLSSLMLLGCPAQWEVVFINSSVQPLSVQLYSALDSKRRAFTLSQGRSHSEALAKLQRLAVFSPSGALLFQRDDFGTKDLAAPLPGKYPHIYVLLTITNAYLIPPDYARTWRGHMDEITKPKS